MGVFIRSEEDVNRIIEQYFLSSTAFEPPEHEKAWFIRVTINACKDLLKSFLGNHSVSLEGIVEQTCSVSNEHSEALEAVLKLSEQYRRVIYLHYYKGYTAPQISKILNKNVDTVYTLITRAGQLLKKELESEDNE